MSPATLSRIETGARPPRLDELCAIASALGTKVVDLIAEAGGEGDDDY